MSDRDSANWETVYTVNDYFDGPRGGIADYRGVPHAYKCEWNAEADDWNDVFSLSPITDDQLVQVQEHWMIWRRWKAAHDAGTLAPTDSHPALAIDQSRYDELQRHVEDALGVDKADAIRATATFRGTSLYDLQVRWSPE